MGAHFSPCGRFVSASVASVWTIADSDWSGNAMGSPCPGI